jgi:hypothetical protein
MKKIYYIDIIFTVICLTLYIVYFKYLDNLIYLLIFSIYIIFCLYVDIRLRSVKKFNENQQIDSKFKIGVVYLILGKLLFITQINLFAIYHKESSLVFMLIFFMSFSYLVLEYTYIDNGNLKKLSGKSISLNDIYSYQILDNFNGSVYLEIHCNSNNKFKCSLSKKNFELFLLEKSS